MGWGATDNRRAWVTPEQGLGLLEPMGSVPGVPTSADFT